MWMDGNILGQGWKCLAHRCSLPDLSPRLLPRHLSAALWALGLPLKHRTETTA